MGEIQLNSPKVVVVREGQDPLELQTTNPDLVRWDLTRVKHRWPKFDEAPFLWLTFISWAAARRTAAISGDVSFEAWRDSVVGVQAVDEDDPDSELGRPTEPGAEPG